MATETRPFACPIDDCEVRALTTRAVELHAHRAHGGDDVGD